MTPCYFAFLRCYLWVNNQANGVSSSKEQNHTVNSNFTHNLSKIAFPLQCCIFFFLFRTPEDICGKLIHKVTCFCETKLYFWKMYTMFGSMRKKNCCCCCFCCIVDLQDSEVNLIIIVKVFRAEASQSVLTI